MAASGTSSTTQLVRADDARLSDTRTPKVHTHAISDTTGLQGALDGKAASSHTHTIGDLPVAASGVSDSTKLVRADDSRLSNTRVPSAHSHAIADVTGLQTALNGKVETSLEVGTLILSGLKGGGTLNASRFLELDWANDGEAVGWKVPRADDSRLSNARAPLAHTHPVSEVTGAVPDTRTISTGTGLSGGGNLTANRTISVVPGQINHQALLGAGAISHSAIDAHLRNNYPIDREHWVTFDWQHSLLRASQVGEDKVNTPLPPRFFTAYFDPKSVSVISGSQKYYEQITKGLASIVTVDPATDLVKGVVHQLAFDGEEDEEYKGTNHRMKFRSGSKSGNAWGSWRNVLLQGDAADFYHYHSISDVTGLQSALNGKADEGHYHSDLSLGRVSTAGITNIYSGATTSSSYGIHEFRNSAPVTDGTKLLAIKNGSAATAMVFSVDKDGQAFAGIVPYVKDNDPRLVAGYYALGSHTHNSLFNGAYNRINVATNQNVYTTVFAGSSTVAAHSFEASSGVTTNLLDVRKGGAVVFSIDPNGQAFYGTGAGAKAYLKAGDPISVNQIDGVGGSVTAATPYLLYESAAANGAASVAHVLSTNYAFSTTGAKLLSVRNQTNEKFYVDKDGSAFTGPDGRLVGAQPYVATIGTPSTYALNTVQFGTHQNSQASVGLPNANQYSSVMTVSAPSLRGANERYYQLAFTKAGLMYRESADWQGTAWNTNWKTLATTDDVSAGGAPYVPLSLNNITVSTNATLTDIPDAFTMADFSKCKQFRYVWYTTVATYAVTIKGRYGTGTTMTGAADLGVAYTGGSGNLMYASPWYDLPAGAKIENAAIRLQISTATSTTNTRFGFLKLEAR